MDVVKSGAASGAGASEARHRSGVAEDNERSEAASAGAGGFRAGRGRAALAPADEGSALADVFCLVSHRSIRSKGCQPALRYSQEI